MNNFETLRQPKPKYLKISSPSAIICSFDSEPFNTATEFLDLRIIDGFSLK